eukprot:5961690-Alexandrium_andersonii.AAC.1
MSHIDKRRDLRGDYVAVLTGSVFSEARIAVIHEVPADVCPYCRCHCSPNWGHIMWHCNRFVREVPKPAADALAARLAWPSRPPDHQWSREELRSAVEVLAWLIPAALSCS